MNSLPNLGVGLGYRGEIHHEIMENQPHIEWLEVITDEYIDNPGALAGLSELRERYPLVPHSLEMSVGSDGPLDEAYLDGVARVAETVDAPWVSDHLCFTREPGIELGELMPVLRTRAKAARIAANAQRVQEALGRPFLLENITYYIDVPGELSEAEMITAVLDRCDCGLLLDLNNVAVNAKNHAFDPFEFLDSLPLDRVVQVHIAGNAEPEAGGVHVDSHSAPVSDEVFELLRFLVSRTSVCGVLLERDAGFPGDFGEILMDLERARRILAEAERS